MKIDVFQISSNHWAFQTLSNVGLLKGQLMRINEKSYILKLHIDIDNNKFELIKACKIGSLLI